jgi:hypothetical protein
MGTQPSQDHLQPVVSAIKTRDRVPRRRPKGPQAVGHPGVDRHKAVIAPRPHRTAPEGADPAQAETLPVPVGGKVCVSQRREPPPLPLLQHERHVVDALRENTLDFMHTQS